MMYLSNRENSKISTVFAAARLVYSGTWTLQVQRFSYDKGLFGPVVSAPSFSGSMYGTGLYYAAAKNKGLYLYNDTGNSSTYWRYAPFYEDTFTFGTQVTFHVNERRYINYYTDNVVVQIGTEVTERVASHQTGTGPVLQTIQAGTGGGVVGIVCSGRAIQILSAGQYRFYRTGVSAPELLYTATAQYYSIPYIGPGRMRYMLSPGLPVLQMDRYGTITSTGITESGYPAGGIVFFSPLMGYKNYTSPSRTEVYRLNPATWETSLVNTITPAYSGADAPPRGAYPRDPWNNSIGNFEYGGIGPWRGPIPGLSDFQVVMHKGGYWPDS